MMELLYLIDTTLLGMIAVLFVTIEVIRFNRSCKNG